MYLGKERRDRTVALVLAAALVATAVLGLLVTLASTGAGASGADASPYGAAPSPAPSASTAADAAAPPVGQEAAHQHAGAPPIDPVDSGIGHPWRLAGTLVGVVLLFGCGILIAREQRRRAEGGGSSDGPGEWIS